MFYTITTDLAVSADEDIDFETAQLGDAICFSNLAEFTALTANCHIAWFAELWNAIAGVPPFGNLRPVKKFENRAIAIKRIFAAIEAGFGPKGAEHCATPPAAATIVPEDDMATKTKKKGAKAKAARTKVATAAAAAGSPAKDGAPTRKDTILALIGRKKGATLGEIMEATGWQKHSVRGFIATLNTKGGVDITSSKNAAGERVYQGVAE